MWTSQSKGTMAKKSRGGTPTVAVVTLLGMACITLVLLWTRMGSSADPAARRQAAEANIWQGCKYPDIWDMTSTLRDGSQMPKGALTCGGVGEFPMEECCCWCRHPAHVKWCAFGQKTLPDGELTGAGWEDICGAVRPRA